MKGGADSRLTARSEIARHERAIHVISLNLVEMRKILARVCAHSGSENNKAVLERIAQMEGKVMSAISQFVEKVTAHNDKIDAAVKGLTGDVEFMKEEIEKFQNSPGPITPEDQASLDAFETRLGAVAEKLDALNALTPPKPPTTQPA